jgi:hypothetical protein
MRIHLRPLASDDDAAALASGAVRPGAVTNVTDILA